MNIKVGVFAEGQMSGEVVNEAKRVLQDIALKYNCRFELTKGKEEGEKTTAFESNLNANLKKDPTQKNGVFLSFGGELELG